MSKVKIIETEEVDGVYVPKSVKSKHGPSNKKQKGKPKVTKPSRVPNPKRMNPVMGRRVQARHSPLEEFLYGFNFVMRMLR